jgi:DNA helicase HerA-like ATPase
MRLIRSKGVGVYFVTQNPLDLPETVLGQLGNRVQHALRAFTPRDQKAVKAAADTFRQNPAFNSAEVITQLGVGEALVSMLGADGTPEIVARALIAPPAARVGTITEDERKELIAKSALLGKYDTPIDRVSAFEVLRGQAGGGNKDADAGSAASSSGGWTDMLAGLIGGLFGGKTVSGSASACRRANSRCDRRSNPPRVRRERRSRMRSCAAFLAADRNRRAARPGAFSESAPRLRPHSDAGR